ncbi:hypothetical protein A9G45_01275 [Gilliamella sp. HK2]|jgi:type IV secretion system protein TrbH|uniref:hypothetical protein n=1 Tax=unclassified Gilliamella TaxID=2685620 RepID=UPI00080DEC5B|nr:hypothetical protein [Gilliamella apicola]OCG28975.1 hypothetical protein A9G46_01660 [Gilliamella apicola]OCG31427.1 hypothetical protein A9G45_01275 [Gilliamella apicola]
MKKLLILISFLGIFLSGCSGMKYGNYTKISHDYNQVFAENAYTQLSILYPPGTSRLKLSHEFNNDAFGIVLHEKLKNAGYAIYQSFNNEESEGISLAYVIDKTDQDTYRVILFIDGKPLTKCFLVKNGKAISLGFWTKQE